MQQTVPCSWLRPRLLQTCSSTTAWTSCDTAIQFKRSANWQKSAEGGLRRCGGRSCDCTGGALAPTLKLRADARTAFSERRVQVRMATILVDARREARSASGRLRSMLSSPPQAERSYSAANLCELRDAPSRKSESFGAKLWSLWMKGTSHRLREATHRVSVEDLAARVHPDCRARGAPDGTKSVIQQPNPSRA